MLMADGSKPEKHLAATIGIDLDHREIGGLYLDPACAGENLGLRMVNAAEKLAVQFGILELGIRCPAPYIGLLQSCGYRGDPEQLADGKGKTGNNECFLHRSFPRRRTRFLKNISSRLSELGITQDYGRIHRIGLQPEASRLHSIGRDIYGREQHMLPAAARAWLSMRREAARDAIELQAVSAFRSVNYQAGIVRKKLDKGQALKDILAVSAAPGFSEHHSGRAIDITSPGYAVLEEEFEKSAAFEWLRAHASDFGYRMSFPRNNRHGVAYEPWHWAWR